MKAVTNWLRHGQAASVVDGVERQRFDTMRRMVTA